MRGNAQQMVIYDVDFNSGIQNMWGPSFSPVTIDQDITLFEEGWNLPINVGGITTIVGQSFGATLNGGFSGLIGSKVSLHGFTSGTVEVNYPIDVELDMSSDLSYDPGDQVKIETSYTVDPGYELNTIYPNVGEASFDVYFRMAAGLSANICFFGCTSFPIIPSFDTGIINLNIVTINEDGLWFLGPGDPTSVPYHPGAGGFPFAMDLQTSPTTSPIPNFVPWQIYQPLFPFSLPDNGFGLTGELSLPHVETTASESNNNLEACGESNYLNMNLELFKLLSNFVPAPFNVILGNLSGSQSLGPAEVNWTIFSASLDANIANHQCFEFTPKVWGKYEFPVAVDYQIYDPSNGSLTAVSSSSIINMELGKELRYKFPCYFEELHITPTFFIDGSIDNFRNHTYDSVSFDFLMSALEFGIEVPSVTIIPGFTIPSVCVTIGYPCGWFDWCTYDLCSPEIVIPPIVSPSINLSYGPLWSPSFPLGSFTYDWLDFHWNLEGFTPQLMDSFTMKAKTFEISNSATHILCNAQSTGAINVTTVAVSPATPYTYTWTNGATTEDLSNLPAGAYELSIIDMNGCQMFTGATILEPALPLAISSTHIDKLCNTGVNTGSIDLSVLGGTPGYSYNWSNGMSSEDISGLDVGNYTVNVTDANGCVSNTSVTIGQPELLGQTGVISNIKCFGENTGSVSATAFGGVLPYSYLWSNGATTSDLNSVGANSYTLQITDGNGCQSMANYNVVQPAAGLSSTILGTDISCKDGNNGTINFSPVGGTPGYSFNWSKNGVLIPFYTEDLTNLQAGTYSVLVTDANGCVNTNNISLTQPAIGLQSNPILTHINCFGNSTGVIDPVISGGTSPYGYVWSTAAATPILNGIGAGIYGLNVVDNAGCTATYSYELTQPSEALSLSLSQTDVLCFGDATGSISSTLFGGTSPYAYSWNTGSTSSAISGLTSGSYDLTATDAKGCTVNVGTTIIEPTAPLALVQNPTNVLCYGNTTGMVDLTISGGTSPYQTSWNNANSLIFIDTTQDLSNLPAGLYTANVTDNHGCQAAISSTVIQPAAPLQINGIVADANCFGINDGAIDATISGGTLPYIFNWSNGDIAEDVANLLAGNYTINITDGNGCVESEDFIVKEPLAPLSVITTVTDVSCNGGNSGSISSYVQGGTAPYLYNWSNGEITSEIESLTSGVYTLTVTDAQGCLAFTGANVNQPAQALIVTPTVTDVSCYGYGDGQIVIDITGGVQPYYFNWGDQNDYLLNNPSETLDNLIANQYFIRVRDAEGCIHEQQVQVNQPTPLTATTQVTNAICFGDANGTIDLIPVGGTAPYTFIWSNSDVTEDITNLLAGNYEYEITDANGCKIGGFAQISQPDDIQVYTQEVPVSCIDQSDGALFITPYGGTLPYTFLWDDGSISQNLEGLTPGLYSLVVYDINLCPKQFDFEIFENTDECLFIPNTITPNGDDYNDTWIIRNIDLYPNATVKIFNKWGNELYSTNGAYTPWDGKVNGQDLPSEVYYYIIILGNEESNEYTGTITILR